MQQTSPSASPSLLPTVTGPANLSGLSLLQHFLRLFVPLALLLIAIAFFLIRHDIELHIQQHIHKEQATLEIASSTMLRDLQTILRDIDYLGTAPGIVDYAANPATADLDQIDQTLLAVSTAARFYQQVCLLDIHGLEISRVNRIDNKSHIVPRTELQAKGNRSYLQEAKQLAAKDVYISPLDLNVEHNRIEQPRKPMIRLVALLRDSHGTQQGYLVINYLAEHMLANLRQITAHSPADFLLLNQDGDYLQAPDAADQWGFMYGNAGLFAARHQAAWQVMQQQTSGIHRDDRGLYIFKSVSPRCHKVDLLYNSMERDNLSGPEADLDTMRWLLVSQLPPARQKEIFHKNIEYAYLLISILLIILAFGCRLISKHRLEKESEIIKNAAIANSSYEAIVMMDHLGCISFWNPSAEQIFGYRAAEVMGRRVHDLIVPAAYRRRFKEKFPLFSETGQGDFVGRTREVRGLRKNGEEFPVELSLTAVRINNQWQGVALLRDISTRKAAEEHLRKLSLAVEESPVSIIITDKRGTIEYVNPKFCEVSQYSREEALGANPRILKSGEQSPQYYREMWECLKAGKEWHGEFANRRKNGELYWERASISPLRDKDGEISHFVAIKEDISREKETLDNLKAAKEEAEKANRAKSDFVANMSHEIRTPLNAVIGLSELGLDMQMPPEAKNYFSKIHQAGSSLLSIINDILDYSKIEAGKLSLAPRSFNTNTLIDNLAGLFNTRVWEKDLELLFEIHREVPHDLIADDMRLSQVLINLIGNALKFTEQGEIIVSVRKVADTSQGINLQFAVKDSGIGISREKIGELFSPFQQADSSISRKYGGTGLGLTISKQLVELMGGHLEVESELGTGTTFSFTVPCRIPRQASPNVLALPATLHNAKVLVADDHDSVGQVTADVLRFFSLRPTVVNSGQAALAALADAPRDDPFTLLLIDWQMPDMDGLETSRRIREDERYGHLPIILLSGWNPQEFAGQAKGLVNAMVSKPVTAPLLAKAIIEALGLESREAGRQTPQAPTPQSETVGRRLLLAEDNPINWEVAVTILSKAGFEVEVVTNGREAVEAMEKSPRGRRPGFAAILMDIQMPTLDGYEATRQIRELEKGRQERIPIIAMTAQAFSEDRDKCLAAGMDDYLSKPIDQEHLFATLARHIKGFSRSAQPPAGANKETEQRRKLMACGQEAIDINEALRRLDNKVPLLTTLLGLFTENYRDVAGRLHEAYDAGDTDQARRLAHTIAGAAANLSALQVAGAARDLQQAIEQGGDFAAAFALFDTSLAELFAAIDEIEERVAEPATSQSEKHNTSCPEAADLFADLVEQLRRNSYKAPETLTSLRAKLPSDYADERLERLGHLVDNFQFKDALKLVATLEKEWPFCLPDNKKGD